MPPSVSVAKPAKLPASSGTSCRWTMLGSRVSVMTTRSISVQRPGGMSRSWKKAATNQSGCSSAMSASTVSMLAVWKPVRPARSSAPSSIRSIIQQDICNGCGYCVPACPFGVPQIDHHDGGVHKCTLCYDRLKDGLEPACAKVLSDRFDPVRHAHRASAMADDRIDTLHAAWSCRVPGCMVISISVAQTGSVA